MTSYDNVIAALEARGHVVRNDMTTCPAHEDHNPSLAVTEGDEGRALLHCHAGCSTRDVAAAIGLTMADLCPPRADGAPTPPAIYDYHDAEGTLIGQVVREVKDGKKSFRQRRPDGRGGWIEKGKGAGFPPMLYRLPQLIAAIADGDVWLYIVEGEKDADTLAACGLSVITNPGGAGKWHLVAEQARALIDNDAMAGITVIADNDKAGRDHAADVAASLAGCGSEAGVLVVRAARGKDATDHFAVHGLDLEDLVLLNLDGGEIAVAPEPIRLARTLPTFPTSALAGWQASYAVALAEATQTPVDLAAVVVLGCAAVAAGGRCVIEVRPGWREPCNLYLVTGMPPGSRKSAVISAATLPLQRAEKVLSEAADNVIADTELRRKIADDVAGKARRAAGNADDDERDELTNAAASLAALAAALVVPTRPRLMTDDATVEAIGALLAGNGGRLALISPLGDVFEVMAGKYKDGPALTLFLKAHAGDTLRLDRMGRDPEYVEHPALTIITTVQPYVIERFGRVEGARQRGLLARILWSIPPSNMGTRRSTPLPVARSTESAYVDNVKAMVANLAGWVDPAVIGLDDAATALVVALLDKMEPRLGPHGDLAHVADWASKWVGAVVRIAGLIHLSTHHRDGVKRTVTAATVDAATLIGRYFLEHALAVFDLMGADPVKVKAHKVTSWLDGREQVTKRDIYAAFRSDFTLAVEVDPVIELLVEAGWLTALPIPPHVGGRPPSPAYVVNPIRPTP